MFNPTSRNWLLALTVCAFALTGCGKKDEPPAATGALTDDAGLLQYVPADSPYVFANLKPLPDDFMDKVEPRMDMMLGAYVTMMREMSATYASKAEAEGSDMDPEQLEGIIDEIGSLMSLEGLRNAGITRESTSVLYGNGLMPVFRMNVFDADAFNAAIAGIEKEAGSAMSTASIGDADYRYHDFDQIRLIIATIGDMAVITMAPVSFDEDQLSSMLGLTPPSESLAESGTLAQIASEYGYTEELIGYMDFQGMVNTFLDKPGAMDAAVFDAFGFTVPDVGDVCEAEYKEIAAIMPRIVTGYESINGDQAKSSAVFELRSDLAEGLSKVVGSVPGMGTDPGGLFAMGMAVNSLAFREFYEARLDAMESDPFECPNLQELQQGVMAGRAALNQPVPPMVYDFKGFMMVVEDVEGLDIANKIPPTSIDAHVLLAMDNAQALLAMGAMMNPMLASLNVEPDGKPVAIDTAAMMLPVESAWIAMTENAIGVAMGEGGDAALPKIMGAEINDPAPFFSMAMDAASYFQMIETAMQAQPVPTNEEEAAAQRAAAAVMQAMSGLYDRVSFDMYFTDRGIEIRSIETFGD